MAEILLGHVSVSSESITSAGVLRIVSADSSVESFGEITAQVVRIAHADVAAGSNAAVSVLAIRIQPVASPITSGTNITSNSRLIKYVKTGLAGVAKTKSNAHKYKTISGALLVQTSVEAYYGDRDVKGAMHDYLPRYYDEFAEVETLVRTGANESTRMRAKLKELLDQYYVESASYGLDRWRGIAGIDEVGARSSESQRDFINAKLRGVGTVTPVLLKSIVDAFYESEINADVSAYKVDIKIVGRRGVPGNSEDIVKAVDDVIPAHLAPNIEYTFMLWSEFDMKRQNWSQAKDKTMADVSAIKWRNFEGEGISWGNVGALTAKEIEESYDLNERG